MTTEEMEQQVLEEMKAGAYAADRDLVTPVDDILMVNPETRLIDVPASEELFGTCLEHGVARKHFKCPRIVQDSVDLSDCRIFINYVSASGNVGQYLCDDVETTADGNYVTFSWKLTRNVFDENRDALIYFAVQAKKLDGDEVFATRKAQGRCYETVEAGEVITEQYADIILQILEKLDNVTEIPPEQIREAVNAYLAEHPPAGISQEQIAGAVAGYLEEHPLQELDPTADSKVAAHNTSVAAHNDIRLLITGLTDRLNALADSDDTTLDQLSEIVAYIKSNKSLIDGITSGKVSVADIINNLTTNAANRPLSAAQGVKLKQLIDAIVIPQVLPNPKKLRFTGAVTAEYDGSSEETINIPSGGGDGGGNTYLPFVTPEQFGAIGDGTADDTAAFESAIASGKKIICSGNKSYKFTGEIISNATKVNIDGHQCTFKGFRLKINVNADETNWASQYPQPCSEIQNIRFENPNGYDSCIKTGIPLKIAHCVVDGYDNWLKNYGSYMDYMVLENILTTNHIGTEYIIDLAHLGDKHVFREVDVGGFGANRKFIRISGCEAATFINCILCGQNVIYQSTANFIGCHGEGISSIALEGDPYKSGVKFLGCYFWDKYGLPDGDSVQYDNCNFFVNYQSYGNGVNDYRALNTRNCRVLCAKENADPQSYILLDDLQKNVYDTATYSSVKCISPSSALAIAGDKEWNLYTGNYEYTFFPSSNPESIEYSDFANSKANFTVSVSYGTSVVGFTADMTYKGMYIWAYRKDPYGIIKRAVFPVRSERYYDYGEVFNGLLWETVSSIPIPKNSKALLKHGIYYTTDGNVNAEKALKLDANTWNILGSSQGGEEPIDPPPAITYEFKTGWIDNYGMEQSHNGSYPDASRSEFIPVEPNSGYVITSAAGVSGDYMRIRKYNSSKSYVGSSESWDTSGNPCTYNVGDNVYFIRILYLDDPGLNTFVSLEKM